MSISLCCLSGGGAGRLAALLELWRGSVDEIVVAVDDRADERTLAPLLDVADQVALVPFAPPVERTLPWLYAQCGGDWILRVDDDEVPSRALLDGLGGLAADDVTHVWLPRRWLFGAHATYLAEYPWQPDFQLRFCVNDPRLVRFPGVTHVPLEVAGPARYAGAPLYHLDLLRPRPERERKAEEYERARPGLRLAGRALNQALYLPEDADPATADVPPDDLALVERVLAARETPAGEPPSVRRATRAEIDALWSRSELDYRVRLEVRAAPARLVTGERAQVELALRNDGDAPLRPPAVQLGARWSENESGLWTPLPATVPAGGDAIVVATVEAPPDPGRRTVEIDLVHDGVRWFGAGVDVPIEIVPRRRVGIFVRAATRARAEPLAQAVVRAAPRLEPVLVGAASGPYAALPGPEERIAAGLAPGRRKLQSFAAAALRVRRVERGPVQLDVEALVLAGLEAATLLERWVDLAAARLAAARGAPILVPEPPPPRGPLDRLLLRLLLRTGGVEVGGDDALPGFLARLDH